MTLSKSHVFPMIKGNAGSKTEYGAEIDVSVVNGFTHITYFAGMPITRGRWTKDI